MEGHRSGCPRQAGGTPRTVEYEDRLEGDPRWSPFDFSHSMNHIADSDRFTLLLAPDNNPAPRNVWEAAGLWSDRSKL